MTKLHLQAVAGVLDTARASDVRAQVGEGRQRKDMEVRCQVRVVTRNRSLNIFLNCGGCCFMFVLCRFARIAAIL